LKADTRRREEANIPGTQQPAVGGLAPTAGTGDNERKKGRYAARKQEGESRAESHEKAERDSCNGKSETSIQLRKEGKPLSERKPSGNVR